MSATTRDLMAALLAHLQDAPKPAGVVVLPPGARWDTLDAPLLARPRLDIDVDTYQGDSPVTARGELVVDVLAAQVDPAAPGTLDTTRRDRAVGDVLGAFVRPFHRVPVFGLAAKDEGAGVVAGVLAVAIDAVATSCTITGGAAFQEDTPQLAIGGEVVTWTGKAPSGADAVFSGLTRGVAGTAARAHQAGVGVLDDPGELVASIETAEPSSSDLGWDVANQRTRSLVRVPLRVDFAV